MSPDLAEKWIAYHSTKQDSLFWAFEELCTLCNEEPELAWETILRIFNLSSDPEILANLAAGPLEDILHNHGHEFIERFEIYTRQNPSFVPVARGVWISGAPKEIRERVIAVQQKYS